MEYNVAKYAGIFWKIEMKNWYVSTYIAKDSENRFERQSYLNGG